MWLFLVLVVVVVSSWIVFFNYMRCLSLFFGFPLEVGTTADFCQEINKNVARQL